MKRQRQYLLKPLRGKGRKRQQQNIVNEQGCSKDFQRQFESENKNFQEFDCVELDALYL